MKLKVAVVGAAGFAGVELVRLLLRHPYFELCIITSHEYEGRAISEVYPAFKGFSNLVFSASENEQLPEVLKGCDLVFLAVPHTASLAITPALIDAGISVIDLSADYRLKDARVYKQWYNTSHTSPNLLKQAAFGLPELTGEELNQAAQAHASGSAILVACAGCYPTATSLAAAPALRLGLAEATSLVVADAISGVTGAGKKPTARTHFCLANENVEAYGVATHRHLPEIEQILGLENNLVFTPHLAPLSRGLLSTVTLKASDQAKDLSTEELIAHYESFYKENLLVHVLSAGQQPRTASVAGTAMAQVAVCANPRAHAIVATCAIDNLGKGAAAQAIQCANIVCNFEESAGLGNIALPV